MGRMTLSVDTTACTGAGTCEAMHPRLFKVRDEGYAVPLRTELADPADIEDAASVLDVCPTEAIRLAEAAAPPGDRD
ncbi:ferredoxin [Streptomyces sp. NPDC090109]|uniref:ferredoxin n=2 Tax=Streptomyces TaxID=1883 RepID=UPI000EF775EF|nr:MULTISPECIES: ferredoxin [unclassified Streptomyces]MZE50223.1 ferredoxin [Streptomyces sp. SID5770]